MVEVSTVLKSNVIVVGVSPSLFENTYL